MKSVSAGAASGCVVWLLTFAAVSMCLCPLSIAVGGITSATSSGYVAGLVGPMLCPADTTPEIHTFATTTTDDFGNRQPATGYELRCLGANGEVVKNTGPTYAFVWIGLLSVVGLVLSALLAILLAVPAGAIIARLTGRGQARNRAPV